MHARPALCAPAFIRDDRCSRRTAHVGAKAWVRGRGGLGVTLVCTLTKSTKGRCRQALSCLGTVSGQLRVSAWRPCLNMCPCEISRQDLDAPENLACVCHCPPKTPQHTHARAHMHARSTRATHNEQRGLGQMPGVRTARAVAVNVTEGSVGLEC